MAKDDAMPLWRLVLLTMPSFGLCFGWSAEFTTQTPYMLSLGLDHVSATLTWIAGPISGLIVQPLVGALSDRFGRRRPFIAAGMVVTVLCQLAYAWSLWMGQALGDHGCDRGVALAIATSAFMFMDLSNNMLQLPARAIVADLAGSRQQQLGQSLVSLWGALGAVCAFAFGVMYDPVLHIREYFAIASVLLVASCLAALAVSGAETGRTAGAREAPSVPAGARADFVSASHPAPAHTKRIDQKRLFEHRSDAEGGASPTRASDSLLARETRSDAGGAGGAAGGIGADDAADDGEGCWAALTRVLGLALRVPRPLQVNCAVQFLLWAAWFTYMPTWGAWMGGHIYGGRPSDPMGCHPHAAPRAAHPEPLAAPEDGAPVAARGARRALLSLPADAFSAAEHATVMALLREDGATSVAGADRPPVDSLAGAAPFASGSSARGELARIGSSGLRIARSALAALGGGGVGDDSARRGLPTGGAAAAAAAADGAGSGGSGERPESAGNDGRSQRAPSASAGGSLPVPEGAPVPGAAAEWFAPAQTGSVDAAPQADAVGDSAAEDRARLAAQARARARGDTGGVAETAAGDERKGGRASAGESDSGGGASIGADAERAQTLSDAAAAAAVGVADGVVVHDAVAPTGRGGTGAGAHDGDGGSGGGSGSGSGSGAGSGGGRRHRRGRGRKGPRAREAEATVRSGARAESPWAGSSASLFTRGVSRGSLGQALASVVQVGMSVAIPWATARFGFIHSYAGCVLVLVVSLAGMAALEPVDVAPWSPDAAVALQAALGIPLAATNIFPFALVGHRYKSDPNLGLYYSVLNIFIVLPQLMDTAYIGVVAETLGWNTVLACGAAWAVLAFGSVFLLSVPPELEHGLTE